MSAALSSSVVSPAPPSGASRDDEPYRAVLAATDAGKTLDAYRLALQIGPWDSWQGALGMSLAARLVRHLGGSSLGWRLAQKSVRAFPHSARVRLQHFYSLLELRGHFSAWHYLPRLERCPTETPLEQAEVLVARAEILLIFRDFEAAGKCFTGAQALAPESPWIRTESADFWRTKNEPEQSLPFYDHALKLKPWFRPAVQGRAMVLQSLSRDDEALALLEEARNHLQFSGIAAQLVTIHSERENWKAMLEAIEDMRAKSPLAEEGLRTWFTARETDALIGLGDLSGAAQKADAIAEDNKWYRKLAERLRRVEGPGRRVKIDVPHILQGYNTCAPATLSAVTTFWQRPIAQETLIDEICYDGTTAVAERRWVESNGWFCREFKVDWDIAVALLDLGLPFILSTQEIDSGHAQCLIGYDTVRGTLLIRDPNVRHHTEMSYEEFEKHYAPVGPRGLLVLPPEKASLVASLNFPETALYDLVYEIASALDAYDRPRADRALAQLAEAAPGHRHYWMACRAMAAYDLNPVRNLEAVDKLRELYPDDDRLIHARVALLRHLGRNAEARATLRERLEKKGAPTGLWNDYAESQRQDRSGTDGVMRLAWRQLKRTPQNLAALSKYASALWESQRKEESLAYQKLTATLGDKNEHVANTYFRMLLALGRSDEGITFLRDRAARLLPLSGDPTLSLAESLHQVHRTQEARETLAAALPQRPQDGLLLLYSSELEAIAVQPQRSAELLESAASCTNRLIWLRAAARLQRRAGHQEQSLVYWRELAATAPLDLESHREIALLLARQEGRSAGVAYLQEIGRRFPEHLGVLQLEIAWLHGHADAELETRLIGFVTANPYNAWAQRELVLFWQRRQPGAIDGAVLQRAQFARQIDPTNASSWIVESSILRAMGRVDEARKCARRSLELWIDNGAAQQQLLQLSETEEEKKEALAFIREQLEEQKAAGTGIPAYREVAFPVLAIDELTTHLRDLHARRPEVWEGYKALIAQLIATGKLDEAQELASEATRSFPLLAETWQQAGSILERRNQHAAAIDYYRFVLQLDPERVGAIHHLAEVYRHESRASEALALLEEAQRRNPLSATLIIAYADNLWRLDRRQEALETVRRAVAVEPDNHWGLDSLSRWSRTLLHHDEALDLCVARAEKLQHDSAAWTEVARLAHGAGQGTTQLNAALRARECDPYNADVHDMLALAYVRQHRYVEALEACWPHEFSGRNPITLRGREAWIFAQQGELDKAIASMRGLVQINPQYSWGWDLLIDWHARKKDLPSALAACERLVRLAPLTASGYLRRADIQSQMKKTAEAKRDLQRAFALSPLPAAAWQLLRLQLDDREYPAAEETLRLMEPNIAPAIMLPARMYTAARRNQINPALDLFGEMASLPEVDVNAVNQAIQVIDAAGRADLLNARLGKVMKHPQLNPYFAALWVARRGAHFKWKLMSQYSQLTTETRARAAFLQEWLRQVGKTKLGLETARLIRKDCADQANEHALVWGNVGRVFVAASQYREAVEWLSNWRDHQEVEGWMVTNLVYAYHGLNQVADADAVSREILDRGLRDHTTSIHLIYLAISDLEAGKTAEARSLFGDIESNQTPERLYIKDLIEAALLVQEAASPEEKSSVYLATKPKLSAKRPQKAMNKPALAQERRLVTLMARDAGQPVPAPPPELTRKSAPELPPAPGSGRPAQGFRPPSRFKLPSLGTIQGRLLLRGLILAGIIICGGIGKLFVDVVPDGPPPVSAATPAYVPTSVPSYSTAPLPTPISVTTPPPSTTANSPSPGLPWVHPNSPPSVTLTPADTQTLSLTPNASPNLPSSPAAPADVMRQALDQINSGTPVTEATALINDALHRAPTDPELLATASEIGRRFKKMDQAMGLAQHAVSVAPTNPRALGDLAFALMLGNHFVDGVNVADRALSIDPNNAPALAAKGIDSMRTRNWDGAIEFLTQSIDSDPSDETVWMLLDSSYRGANRFPDGETKLHELLVKYPDSEPGYMALGSLLNEQKKVDDAKAAFNTASKLNSNDYALWNNIGLNRAAVLDYDNANAAFLHSLKLNPVYDEGWNNFGYTLLLQGKTPEAIDCFKKVLVINTRHTRAMVNLMRAYLKAGQHDDAVKTWDLLATVDPKLADSIHSEVQ